MGCTFTTDLIVVLSISSQKKSEVTEANMLQAGSVGFEPIILVGSVVVSFKDFG